MAGAIQKATEKRALQASTDKAAKGSISTMLNAFLDREGMRKRFDELLGERSPQFISSVVSLVNADVNLQKAFNEAPMTVIQAALKAATYDLPIDPNLGYAYIMPFNNSIKNPDGTFSKRHEATFILGWKGMNQLALRTGSYKTINVIDVREGELKRRDRLRGDLELEFIVDEDERDATPIVGYAGYYRLMNGAEKIIYMTKKQVEKHEETNRKGQFMTKAWRDNFESMALKTVFRKLIGDHGLMSIDYRSADKETLALATAIADEENDNVIDLGADGFTVQEDAATEE
jgi:recombination protein RecT